MGTQIKGSSLEARLLHAEDRLGAGAPERIIDSLSPDDRRKLRRILPAGFYHLELAGRLDRAIAAALDPQDPAAVWRDLGRSSAELNLRNVHQVFVRGNSPHDFLSRFPSVRQTYYSDGIASYERRGPRTGVLRVAGASTQTQEDCESTAGYLQRGLEIMGGIEVSVEHPLCSGAGDECCEFSCRWSAGSS